MKVLKLLVLLLLNFLQVLISILIFAIIVSFLLKIKLTQNDFNVRIENFSAYDYLISILYGFMQIILKENSVVFIICLSLNISYLILLIKSNLGSKWYICFIFYVVFYLVFNIIVDTSFFKYSNLLYTLIDVFALSIVCFFINKTSLKVVDILQKI